MGEVNHYPVMYREVLDLLKVKEKRLVVDCTVGTGHHALRMLEVMAPDARLVGIDKDEESLSVAASRLKGFEGRFTLAKSDFHDLDSVLNGLGIKEADAFLFDLGISTYQLLNPERGFSFSKDGPLDMRMDREAFLSAADLVGSLNEDELGDIFKKFGEERYARRVASALVEARRKEPIQSTTALADIIYHSVPVVARHTRIHPATRIFQALRIAVNRELDVIDGAIRKAVSFLTPGGHIGVISFHSLEDRIAKHTMRDLCDRGSLSLVVKKPACPSQEEVNENSASRSAKLRVAVKNKV
jgi:16S rRNA (cytosine1402-N4)-methyltransferase